MDLWREQASLNRAEVLRRLTPDHFGGEMPKRTAVYAMFKGKDITWEFLEAVADICTETPEDQQALCNQAKPIFTKSGKDPTPLISPEETSQQQLIDALSELKDVQAELLRVRQLRETSDQTLIAANQMVMMLLMVVGQLQSQIASLNHQINNLAPRQPNADTRAQLQEQLSEAQIHHQTAQSQLGRAQHERDDALGLSHVATVEAQALTEEAQLLREVNDLGVDESLEIPLPPLPTFGSTNGNLGGVGDIATTLQKIRNRLDHGAEGLDDVRTGLRDVLPHIDESIIVGKVVPATNVEDTGEAQDRSIETTMVTGELEKTATLAAKRGYAPTHVLRYTDSVMSHGSDPITIYLLFSEAIPQQTQEERTESRRLLGRLRRSTEVLGMWDAASEDVGNHAAGMPPQVDLKVSRSHRRAGDLIGHQGIQEISGRKPWTTLAQLIGLRSKASLRPRFGYIKLQDDSEALIVAVHSGVQEMAEVTSGVLARFDDPAKIYLINIDNLPDGALRSSLLSIQPWHLTSRPGSMIKSIPAIPREK